MDPTPILDKHLDEQIQDPYHYDFRDEARDEVTVEPDISEMTAAVVDLGNQNVKVSYEDLSARENFKCVEYDEEEQIGIVESNRVVEVDNKLERSRIYYAVEGEEVYRHTGTGLEETPLNRPLEVFESFEELYTKALAVDEEAEKEKVDRSPDPVPPPEEDELFSDL